jgi:hypothetical protein
MASGRDLGGCPYCALLVPREAWYGHMALMHPRQEHWPKFVLHGAEGDVADPAVAPLGLQREARND